MPRKPKFEKHTIPVIVNGVPVQATMFPPSGKHRSWYAYWKGLKARRSTNCRKYDDAVVAVDDMLNNGGKKRCLSDAVLSDGDLIQIQQAHFLREQSPDRKRRAKKSLELCLEAVRAFQAICPITPISLASADDCARFQRDALELPRNWRQRYPKSKTDGVERLKPNTVHKWSRSLQAAFERANLSAGKKCVRGIVSKDQLLTANPWHQFAWAVNAMEGKKRRLSDDELISVIQHFESQWQGVTVATCALKTAFWCWCRVEELANLKWGDLHIVGDEHHFRILGKSEVVKWARIPAQLRDELVKYRTASEFVFAAYNDQLRLFYTQAGQSRFAQRVGAEFSPSAFVAWLQDKVEKWSQQAGIESVTPHAFRRTALQFARQGEDIREANEAVAKDAKVSTNVMLGHYVDIGDEQLWHASNRTYNRLLAGLPQNVARRFGVRCDEDRHIKIQLHQAVASNEWAAVHRLAGQLAATEPQFGGNQTA